MCGIAGIIHKKAGKGVNIGEQMTSMLQALKHRWRRWVSFSKVIVLRITRYICDRF